MKSYNKIDTSSFHDIFDDALEEWKQLSGNTAVYPYEISYTLLEMMSMLSDMLNYYMEADSTKYIKAYMTLLCMNEEQMVREIPLQCEVEDKMILQEGTIFPIPWGKQDAWLECRDTCVLDTVRISNILFEQKGKVDDITYLLTELQGTFRMPRIYKNDTLYIVYDHPLSVKQTVILYISCFTKPNGSSKDKGNSWVWEYYTVHGWEKLEVLKDNTMQFFTSGNIHVKIHKVMQEMSLQSLNGFFIRCRYFADVSSDPFEIQSVLHNVGNFSFQISIANFYQVRYTIHTDGWMIEHAIAKENYILLSNLTEKSFKEVKCYRKINNKSCLFYLMEASSLAQDLILVCYRNSNPTYFTNGVSSQRIQLPQGQKPSYLLLEKNHIYTKVKCCSKQYMADYAEGCWLMNDYLQFGNGKDFFIPEKGCRIIFMQGKQYSDAPHVGCDTVLFQKDQFILRSIEPIQFEQKDASLNDLINQHFNGRINKVITPWEDVPL